VQWAAVVCDTTAPWEGGPHRIRARWAAEGCDGQLGIEGIQWVAEVGRGRRVERSVVGSEGAACTMAGSMATTVRGRRAMAVRVDGSRGRGK
jgi:hypothetical protein